MVRRLFPFSRICYAYKRAYEYMSVQLSQAIGQRDGQSTSQDRAQSEHKSRIDGAQAEPQVEHRINIRGCEQWIEGRETIHAA